MGNASTFMSCLKRTEMPHLHEILLWVTASHTSARAGIIRKMHFRGAQQQGATTVLLNHLCEHMRKIWRGCLKDTA